MGKKLVLLIIGGQGLLGEHLAKAGAPDWDVWIASRSVSLEERKSLALDVTNRRQVRNALAQARPDLVAHLAAVSDIDRCEREPDIAWAINVIGAQNVAEECARIGARLIFTSSAAVFDGTKQGYREEDPPNPLSVYGKTKLEAERRLAAIIPSAIIIRPALVLGLSSRNGTPALLNRWINSWRSGKPVVVPTTEYRNPVDVQTLAEVILDVGQNPTASGIYHVGALDSMSRFEIACRVAKALGYTNSLVLPQTESSPGRARRGPDHFLITERLRNICKIPLGATDDVIQRSLHVA